MFDDRDPPHYLKALKTTTTPKRLLWLDCAGYSNHEHGIFVERWASGALGQTHWTSRKGERKDVTKGYATPDMLWADADSFCHSNRRVVLFAYDLPLQLRLSRALIELPALGWHLDKIVLERTASWALFRDDDRTLMLCDLRSWTPATFDHIATDVTGFAHGLVHELGDVDRRADACRWRVAVLREAILQLFDWIHGENLGPFRPTGSGQSYSAFRRRFLAHKLLVHDDSARLALERAAMHTGRCEAWRHGSLNNGPYVEYDMTAAYCRIAAECDVPTVAIPNGRKATVKQLQAWMQRYALLADVTVTTDVPCVPTRLGGRTVWPVGTFRTALYDPELQLAIQYASDLKVNTVYLYHRAPALQQFATWVLDGMTATPNVNNRVSQRVLKHWSRCLVGRLGLRYRAWEKFGTQHPPDLRLITFIDTDEKTSTDMLIAGTDRLILADMTEGAESLPQIPGWVMSECRRRLWEAMCAVGFGSVVYVDTDSIVARQGDTVGDWAGTMNGQSDDWTRKGTYSRMVIHGPRNLVCESTRRVSGLPLTARQTAPLEFSGEIMRSIKESMRAGELDCVATIPRKFVLDAPDLRRQHLSGGMTAPFEVQLPATTGEDDDG